MSRSRSTRTASHPLHVTVSYDTRVLSIKPASKVVRAGPAAVCLAPAREPPMREMPDKCTRSPMAGYPSMPENPVSMGHGQWYDRLHTVVSSKVTVFP
eukprot:758404-Hanusia_phi.AAC.5